MPSDEDQSTVRLSKATKERLRQLGAKGDTYEEIVVELLEIAEERTNESI